MNDFEKDPLGLMFGRIQIVKKKSYLYKCQIYRQKACYCNEIILQSVFVYLASQYPMFLFIFTVNFSLSEYFFPFLFIKELNEFLCSVS